MKCTKCNFDNPEGRKFCGKCGTKIESICPSCQSANPPDFQFCGDCGHKLDELLPKAQPLPPSDSARKHVTVLFSDMSGYTAMTEKLDPEETKEIMGKIFAEISKVVAKYGGFIEKFIGDAVMAIFGVPTAHEDDPVRAIKVSREIHDVVSSLSSQFEKRIGKALCMHTGICTGLVVTGEVNLEKGTHGVLGDTINTAARLSGLAKPGEIVISPDTHHQAEGYFNFEALEPTTVKGKAEPIRPYRVLSAKEDPTKTHRLSGMRADLIGRKVEMAQLQEAVTNLKQGKGSIFSVVGDAGTGKSRLIQEFKTGLDLNTIQWREGHAYAYSQNIPYFPLMNLLSRAWQIQDGDQQEQIRQKAEAGAGFLLGERKDLIPYVVSLYSIKYPEIENVSPETWKARLHEAIQLILTNLCKKAPAIICLEDLHWADPSSVELLRNILSDFRHPAIFLCIYRPSFSLFTSHQASSIKSYHEIRLQDLSPTDAQNMIESLLKTETIPGELKKFIRDRVEGNPFYLEEVINSLLETETLVSEGDSWKLTKPLIEVHIPSTVQGVISARLDRLETETKQILQEASVIGRAFLYEILKRITELKEQIDKGLMGLERLDLIRTRSLQPDLEYIFKHALTQEVVYNGLLKKDRQAVHEKIGLVMEELFLDRLPEFYETLAFHFKQGYSVLKAVDYLMKAGEKSYKRYSIDEAHQYYMEAFELLTNKTDKSKEENMLLMDMVLNWATIYHLRGANIELIRLLKEYESLAISIGDNTMLGILYMKLGNALQFNQEIREGHQYLTKSLKIGEETESQQIIGYSLTGLCYTCRELGFLEEAISHGERVRDSIPSFHVDNYLSRLLLAGLGTAYMFTGDVKKCKKTGDYLVNYGIAEDDPRALSVGFRNIALSYYTAGDFPAMTKYLEKAVQACPEPLFVGIAKTLLAQSYLATGHLKQAEDIFDEILKFDKEFGLGIAGTWAKPFGGVVTILKGDLNKGISIIEDAIQEFLENGSRYRYALFNHSLGKVYLQIAQGGGGKKDFSFLAKNIGFLIKTVPFAHKKAEERLTIAIETAKEIGAKGVLAQANLDMGRLRQTKGKTDEARKYIRDSIQLFEECEADVYLKQAKEALAFL